MNKKQEWLTAIDQYYTSSDKANGSIILLPGYQPELCMMLCNHLKMRFYDYRQEEMQVFGHEADTIDLGHLNQCLQTQSQSQSIFAHNIEALLCVKTKQERQDWLLSFLNADWPNPIFLSIAVFQDDVPEDHSHVCDFELMHIPRKSLETAANITSSLKYDIAGIKSRVY